MTKIKVFFIFLGVVCLVSAQKPNSNTPNVSLKVVAQNLISPVCMVAANDGSGRKFVVEQRGIIYILDKNNQLLSSPFLDLKDKITKLSSNYDERGLLGMALHPDFKKNGRFFVYYSSTLPQNKNDHIAVLSEFKADPTNPNKSFLEETVILTIPQPEWNHNGGQILFDTNGYLLLGLGDGGNAGDSHGLVGNGQNLKSLLGKIIRIDINKLPYAIPSDNPFVGSKEASPEIYAYGLRNPWRFSLDKITNQIFCGDVGQNKYEEINIIEKGKNYGWKIMEGYHFFEPRSNANPASFTLPITEYDHSVGSSICGGFVYRGKKFTKMYGKYIFADWRGVLFCLTQNKDKTWNREILKTDFVDFKNININSLAEDTDGELYLLVQDLDGPFQLSGKILQLNFL